MDLPWEYQQSYISISVVYLAKFKWLQTRSIEKSTIFCGRHWWPLIITAYSLILIIYVLPQSTVSQRSDSSSEDDSTVNYPEFFGQTDTYIEPTKAPSWLALSQEIFNISVSLDFLVKYLPNYLSFHYKTLLHGWFFKKIICSNKKCVWL